MLNTVTIKDVKTKIGEWCKLKRQTQNMTQEDLATALDMSRLTIQKVENGKNATIDTLLKIAYHFDSLETIHTLLQQEIENSNRTSLY